MDTYVGSKTRSAVLIAFAVLAFAIVFGAGTALAAGAMRQSTDVLRFDGVGGAVGEANLVRTNSGVSMNIRSSVEGELFDLFAGPLGVDFMPGDATTNWFIVFNMPANCITAGSTMCGEEDVIDAATGGADLAKVGVIFATGHIAGSKWNAAAHLKEGDSTGLLFGTPLMDAMTAEVHIVVRSHGPASALTPSELHDAISSVGGGCGTNVCGDPLFAVFPAP